MDRAAIFTELTLRNALRKAAKLPLLDLRAEMAFAVAHDAERVYAEQCKRFDDDRRRLSDGASRYPWAGFSDLNGWQIDGPNPVRQAFPSVS